MSHEPTQRLDTTQRCEVCNATGWEVILDSQAASVCSGREVVRGGTLVKGMCERCGFVRTLQSPLDAQLDAYYRDTFSSKLHTGEYDYINYSTGKTFSQTLNDFVLAHAFPQAGRMLDIGCGKGLFEEAFVRRYPHWWIEGVDPSVRSIELARVKVPTAEWVNRKFKGADHEPESYDLVCMHTVLNRVSTRTFMREASGLLKPDGIMSIEVALLDHTPAQLYYADHHCLMFQEHLLALAEEFQLELVARDPDGPCSRFLLRRRTSPATDDRDRLFATAPQVKDRVRKLTRSWQEFIKQVNEYKLRGARLSFYGAGTVFVILLAQTEFPTEQIVGMFEDNPHKIGELLGGVEVEPLSAKVRNADAIVLCAGPTGTPAMRKRLGGFENIIEYGAPAPQVRGMQRSDGVLTGSG